MTIKQTQADALFLQAEQVARDFSLFPRRQDPASQIDGLVRMPDVRKRLTELGQLEVDAYIAETVLPSEDKARIDGKTLIRRLKGKILQQADHGPLYWAEMVLEHDGQSRRIGFIVQNRGAKNGVWMPEHHHLAAEAIRDFAKLKIPIVTFIDTPGADAGAEANAQNQAHSISRLIAEMSQVDVPCIGIILGYGYSGGAIPLATANMLLSVRDGVFNTIQPPGLASIVRKYDLSWQECAKYVGVSAYELYDQGYIDGIIDYVPGERHKLQNLRSAILSSILLVERNAEQFVAKTPLVLEHYRRSMERYLKPADNLKQIQDAGPLSIADNPTCHLNVFGITYRYLRYLSMRKRIRSISIDSYGRLSEQEIPKGDLKKRADDARAKAFEAWLQNPLELRYDDKLQRAWRHYQSRQRSRTTQPGRLRRLVFGTPESQFETARSRLCLEYTFFLYNLWKNEAPGNFLSLHRYLTNEADVQAPKDDSDLTILGVMRQEGLREAFIEECENMLVFDQGYNFLIEHLSEVAHEAHQSNTISEASVRRLVGEALGEVTARLVKQLGVPEDQARKNQMRLRRQFRWFGRRFMDFPGHAASLKAVENWKKQAYPRLSETLFAVATFFCEQLLPRYYRARFENKPYDARIQPRNIGIKDFWNRLAIAYRDLLIQDLLAREKRTNRISPERIIERYFDEFQELNRRLMSADPVNFPGFRLSIETALSKDITPCGLITGIGRFKGADGQNPRVGVAISNIGFQAGAFDMASAEKFCHLLCECMLRRIPVVCFISSGGMQTKEGAGSLFSMPIVNDRLTRFVRDQNLPVICFGFGDCTGGAQASFVTHPLVLNYYFSGTNMPFAGQIVVPSYLPSTSTLSNYLSEVDGAMHGLVSHPFWENLDAELTAIDPRIPLASESVEDVVMRILEGRLFSEAESTEVEEAAAPAEIRSQPVRRLLIHARGCPAAKLVRKCQEHGVQAVLAQSDADADSAVADLLGDNDTLVCIGGNTADESYLNALSIIRVAEQEQVDAVHPGIGFLSENPDFAELVAHHGLNFVGPKVQSMELMGNKSNAINTALKLKVPVVPGSRGIVTTVTAAKRLAADIGYPVLIKAVHGGGGKGIRVVEEPELFAEAFKEIRAEAKSAFGNNDVYLEKFITSMRHVEIQVLRDRHGNTRILGLRDCSVQRNNQKIIEESGSTLLPGALEQDLYNYAAAIADACDYEGAGTVEFIYDVADNCVYFMEMNTRLQVEHPVTEAVTHIDIVKAQFDIASGKSIESIQAHPEGYAIEVRVNAESVLVQDDKSVTLRPSPGLVEECVFPPSDSIDLLCSVASGKTISPFYDNMIAQVICTGSDRNDTADKLIEYLDRVVIRGVATNIPLLKRILADEIFRNGDYDTRYLPNFFKRCDIDAIAQETAATATSAGGVPTSDSIRIEGTNELKVVAPSTGVFYITPSPSDPDMVSVGDIINSDTPMCLLEAMKLFTTLALEDFNADGAPLYPNSQKYRVVRIVATSGQVVNAGDLMFVVAPQ